MTVASSQISERTSWLLEHGPKQLELLLRSIVCHPSASMMVLDGHGNSVEACIGAAKKLGLPREKIIGRSLDELAAAPVEGAPVALQITGKTEILPERHAVILRGQATLEPIASPAEDYALFVLDLDGNIAAWYAGAERLFGYSAEEALGQHLSLLYETEPVRTIGLEEELRRASLEDHSADEGWGVRKDGSKFWANAITLALKDEDGGLQGFGRVVRDFSERHERDEKLRRSRARIRPISDKTAPVGIVSGEFDQVPEANDAFLAMLGYTRQDLAAGNLRWVDLTPPEFAELDELAHEEGLRFKACTPYRKELIAKNGQRIPVLFTMVVLQVVPFKWMAFVQDLREQDRFESVTEEVALKEDFGEIVGNSQALKRVQQNVELVAPTDATVLILGETGTGKELIARAIHRLSPRKHLPFVTLNCAAIPTGLLESELFGYERGAFTGALQQKIGRFEMAHKGTLFLDEVGDIPLDLQPKLLRALQEKAFERLGGTKTIPIDVRLVAATNRNLTQMMGDKLFRSDLYYRLKVFPITSPPLRDRPEDIAILARHFTKKYAEKMGRQIDKIPAETIKALVEWRWPGNVRELENFIERSVILSSGNSLRAPLAEIREDARAGGANAEGETLEHVEREHILKILRESESVVSTAATRLGLHRTTLNAMMKKLGITRDDF